MPVKHFLVGGSTAERTLLCPGWVSLVKKLKIPNLSNAAARRGTLLHDAMDSIIREKLQPKDVIGMRCKELGDQVIDSTEVIRAVMPALHAFREFTKGVHHTDVKSEVQVKFDKRVGGTADVLAQRGAIARVGDFKFGSIRVEPSESAQLRFYAAAGLACGKLKPFDRVRLGIVQPKHKEVLTEHVETAKAIAAFTKDILAAAKLAFSKKPPLRPSPTACEWCPAKELCPAQGTGGWVRP